MLQFTAFMLGSNFNLHHLTLKSGIDQSISFKIQAYRQNQRDITKNPIDFVALWKYSNESILFHDFYFTNSYHLMIFYHLMILWEFLQCLKDFTYIFEPFLNLYSLQPNASFKKKNSSDITLQSSHILGHWIIWHF